MKYLKPLLILITTLALLGCGQTSDPKQTTTEEVKPASNPVLMAKRIEAHMQFLADDLLKGRDTASPEYEIAARYVASTLKQMGVEPGGENGSWLQPVTFVRSTIDKESVSMSYTINGETTPIEYIEEGIVSSNPLSEQETITAEVVFVGYGIEAPSLGHNDYDGIDVKDKIVMILAGRPASFPSEEGAHLSSNNTKMLTAVKHGAIGIVGIHTPYQEMRYSYNRIKNYTGRPSLTWKNSDGKVHGHDEQIKARAYLSMPSAGKIFAAAGHDLNDVFKQLENNEVPLPLELGMQMSFDYKTSHTEIVSNNVIGIIAGSDPVLKNEYVVYSAHLDHIGVRERPDTTSPFTVGDTEDLINNGALDNASGISVMLETAREFVTRSPPKRSILFAAVTAEEKGLLGSSYFASNPTVTQSSMVANINLDMPMILYPFGDIIAFGAQHSAMSRMVENALTKMDLKLSPDPMPEQAIFTRSDHYSFVKQGVPSIFLVPGWESKDPDIDGGKVFQTFLRTQYHSPSDDLNLPINYESATTFTMVNFEIGKEIANSSEKPRWNEGNFFGDLFTKPATK